VDCGGSAGGTDEQAYTFYSIETPIVRGIMMDWNAIFGIKHALWIKT